jgi:hypothetical protein
MRSHNFSPILPPYPDPRKWKQIHQQQERGPNLHWMTSSSATGSFPFPSDFVVASQSESGFAPRNAECSVPSSTEPNIGTTITACDYHATQSIEDNSLGKEKHHEERLSASEYCDNHDGDCIDGDHQNEELGEEVEILELNDFWLNRLSKTVKRMNSRNKKSR